MIRSIVFLFFISLAQVSNAEGLKSCLQPAFKTQHRLNRFDAIQDCFEKNKLTVSEDQCYLAIQSVKIHNKSIELNEKMNSICFYEASRFKSISSCLVKAKEFSIANNHDEAVFECYRQFQNQLNKQQCLTVSKLLKYPDKKNHLENHCLNNVN